MAEIAASDVSVRILDQSAWGSTFYPPTMTLQEYLDSVFSHGLVVVRDIDGGLTRQPSALDVLRGPASFVTTYTAALPHDRVGSNGVNGVIFYGTPAQGASGYANVNNLFALVEHSIADPADPYGDPAKNEIGGTIAVMRMGAEGQEVPPRATFWGTSYTLRGGWRGQEPGGLGAYSAVVQNHFDGRGSRIDHYAYAAVTWPGIGDGDDFWKAPGEGDRYADTFAVPFGFIVAGQSGRWPDGGGVGYEVGVQSGGWTTPWRGDKGHGFEDTRSKIGTGFRSIDWVTNGIHVGTPHPDADARAASIVVDGTDVGPARPIVARRTCTAAGTVLSEDPVVLSDGRVKAPTLVDDDDAVSVRTLSTAYARAVGSSARSLALAARATATTSVPPGVRTPIGPLTMTSHPPASMYASGPDAVEVLLPGEYEVTVRVDWAAIPTGSFRALWVMTQEDGGVDPKPIAESHIPSGMLAAGVHGQDAYQSSFRVRSDEAGKPVFVAVMHDADSALPVTAGVVVRPVTFAAG